MLRIKNWQKFQHFKDRTPPWVKLYREILDDPDWHSLDSDAAKVLIGLWLIASEDETKTGTLPDVRKLAFRLRISEKQLNQALTKLSHWVIQDDIEVISERYQLDAPETETETETDIQPERKNARFAALEYLKSEGVQEQVAIDWLAVRKAKKAANTQTAFDAVKEEAKKAGMSMADAIAFATKSGWQGFKASWINGHAKQQAQTRVRNGRTETYREGIGWVA